MLKLLSTFALTVLLISHSLGQTKTTSDEPKKLASSLIESFYTMKASYSTALTKECSETIKERLLNLSKLLQTKLDNNKIVVLQKLGQDDVKEVESFIKALAEYQIKLQEDRTPQETMSVNLWLELWKVKIEKVFIKLNK